MPSVRGVAIRIRLALAYALFLILTFGIVGGFVLTSLESGMQRQVDVSLTIRAARVQQQLAIGADGRLDRADAVAALADIPREDDLDTPVIWVQLLDATGTVLAAAPDLAPAAAGAMRELVGLALAGEESSANLTVGGDRIRVLARPIAADGQVVGVMIVAESLHVLDDTYREVASLLTIAAIVAALAAMAGGWWLTGRALGPVAALTRVARSIATTGQFEQRITLPPAQDELSDLVATFNDMLARLAKTFQRQREFLGNASHELRGPLTVIRGNLDLLRLDLPEVERQMSVDAATREVERMSRLVSDLLFLAEVDNDQIARHEPVALHQVVEEAWQRARLADAGAHELVLARNDPTIVRGDQDRLAQLLSNLVQNALRYTPEGGTVTLSLATEGPIAELSVADTGVGIAAEHLPRIFDRFYRVEKRASRAEQGTGLGLPIVKEVAEAHGGQVRVWSEPGQGSAFTIILPAVDRSSPGDVPASPT